MTTILDKYSNREVITMNDVKTASDDSLRDLKCMVDKDLAAISMTLARVESEGASGQYMEPGKFGRLIGAKKFKGVLSQWIQMEFSRRNREWKECAIKKSEERNRRNMFHHCLLDAMDVLLDSSIKDRIVQRAMDIQESREIR